MGPQQNLARHIPDQISEIFIVIVEIGHGACPRTLPSLDDVDDRERKQPLRGFLEVAVKGFVKFVADDERRPQGGEQPHHCYSDSETDPQPLLEASGPLHGRPSR